MRPLQILLVDDNVDSAQMLQILLEEGGHTVWVAHDGPSALESARLHRPEVVILDIGLPGMHGYEVARRLREQQQVPRPMLVAMTGYGMQEDQQRSLQAGFDHHLVKPVELDHLCRIIASYDEQAGWHQQAH